MSSEANPDSCTIEGLIAANAAFYAAFESLDMEAFRQVNAVSEDSVCIHPGRKPVYGWEAIQDSWSGIFEHTTYMSISPSDVKAQLHGVVGWVTCVENIYSFIEVEQILGRVVATNLFKWTDSGWELVLHHGSPILQSDDLES